MISECNFTTKSDRWGYKYDKPTTFPCWIQSEVKEVVWCFRSNEVYFVNQMHRTLVLPHPLNNQLTFRDPPTWFTLICILPRDLVLQLSMRLTIKN